MKINNLEPLEASGNEERISQWIQMVKGLIVAHLPNYLNLINSLQSLCSLKRTVAVSVVKANKILSKIIVVSIISNFH